MNKIKVEDKFQTLQALGRGAFSIVYKVKRIEDAQIYALKKVSLKNLKPKDVQNALNEIRILASVKHPNIVSYKEAFVEKTTSCLCIVMEFAGGGDLAGKIKEAIKARRRMPEEQVLMYAYQLTSALNELHGRNIIHRDLKAANVFLSSDQQNIKLGDLNVSKVVKNDLASTQTGTPYYASPEVWRDESYSAKTDIWSLGCVIYELCMYKPPFSANDMHGLYEKVQQCIFEPFDDFYSEDLKKMVFDLLTLDPKQRPTCEEILSLPIFDQFRLPGQSKRYSRKRKTHEMSFQNELLGTITMEKNIFDLQKKLPKPQYSTENLPNLECIVSGENCDSKSKKANHKGPKRPLSGIDSVVYDPKIIEQIVRILRPRNSADSQIHYEAESRDGKQEILRPSIGIQNNRNNEPKRQSKLGQMDCSPIKTEKNKIPKKEAEILETDKTDQRIVLSTKGVIVSEKQKPISQTEKSSRVTTDRLKLAQPNNEAYSKHSLSYLKGKAESSKILPKIASSKDRVCIPRITSASQKASLIQSTVNEPSDIDSVKGRPKTAIENKEKTKDVKSLQKKLKEALFKDHPDLAQLQERIRHARKETVDGQDSNATNLTNKQLPLSKQILLNKRPISGVQSQVQEPETERQERATMLPSINGMVPGDSSVKQRQSKLSGLSIVDKRKTQAFLSGTKNIEKVPSLLQINPQHQISIDGQGKPKILRDIKSLPHFQQLSKKLTVSEIEDNHKVQGINLEMLSKEASPQAINQTIADQNLIKSNLRLKQLRTPKTQEQHLANDFSTQNLTQKYPGSLITNSTIGLKQKSSVSTKAIESKKSNAEIQDFVIQQIFEDSNKFPIRRMEASESEKQLPLSYKIFKRPGRPSETDERISSTDQSVSRASRLLSSKILEPIKEKTSEKPKLSNLKFALNEELIQEKLKSVTNKRVLSAGLFKKLEQSIPADRLLSAQKQDQPKGSSDQRFVLKRKGKTPTSQLQHEIRPSEDKQTAQESLRKPSYSPTDDQA